MDIILIPGLWLKPSIWAETAAELERRGHRPIALRLPGVDLGPDDAALDDQLAAVVAEIDASEGATVVGHSAACTLAWMAADRRPDSVARVVLIGGFPATAGDAYADFFEITDGGMAFPGWTPFEGPDSADLDAVARARIAADAVPVPEAVSKGIVTLSDERRYEVPVVLVCPEYSPDQAKSWIDSGEVPELERTEHVSFVDIDSGHWPMVSRPVELARILDQASRKG